MISPNDYDSDLDYQSAVSDEEDRRAAKCEKYYEDAREAHKCEKDLRDKTPPVNLYRVDDGWRPIYIVARSEGHAVAMWLAQINHEGLAPCSDFPVTVTLLTPDQTYVPKILFDRDAVAGSVHHGEFKPEVPHD